MAESTGGRVPATRRDKPEHLERLGRREFAARFEESSPALWCIAAAVLGGRDHAEDVVQEAALIALRKLDEFDPATSFTAWVGQIVRYTALNERRRRAKGGRSGVDPAALPLPERPGPEDPPVTRTGGVRHDQNSFDDEVMRALGELEETARACLLLRTVLDMPYREIAGALGIPEGTAMSHVHRSRMSMRRKLRSDGGGGGGATEDGQA
jgi:RNA polymerase sigma-70 factor, ECF subfamily